MRFKNKVVLVTGAAAGIGKACAEKFGLEGAKVIVSDVNEKLGGEVVSDIKSKKGEAYFILCDVTDDTQLNDLVQKTYDKYGAIDILVNNAGIIHSADFLDIAVKDFDRVLNVNLRAPFVLGQCVAKQMVKHGIKGSIINMSSVNAILAIPNQVPYVVSKGGMKQLTKVMAMGLCDKGIRVNAVGPGSIMTDLLKGIMTDQAARTKILSRTPMGRCGEPSEVASVVAFLASDDASYMTGQTIYPDGGRLSLNYTVPVKD